MNVWTIFTKRIIRLMENSESLLKTAANLRSERQFSDALNLYTECITKCLKGKCSKNELASAYNERGFTKYLAVDFDGAVDDYTSAIRACESAVYYYNRAVVHYRLARFQQAVDDASRALVLKPEFSDALQCHDQAIIDGNLKKVDQPVFQGAAI
ncbi:tetratricopeptide repeat protein 32-like [Watersipora subatra]|uniref:tetratricopeptide repeat protein 32-like n=1 Tax=Watersipora subatra TaxID=2589382 RepID=UPI00355C6410